MNTWSSKVPVAALSLSMLSACGATSNGGFDLGGKVENHAAPQAQMAFGDVTLVPPPGFCIDTRSLSEQFAMMARCDVLGAPEAPGDTPLGMITVSLSAETTDPSLPSPAQTAAAQGLTNVTDEVTEENRVFFRATGDAPVRQMAAEHWRGSAVVASYVMWVALYGPKGGRALSPEGLGILSTLISQAQTPEADDE